MSNKKRAQLNMAKLIAPMISSRDIVEVLSKAINKTGAQSVDFDFFAVKFISRSAAHALLLFKEELMSRGMEINFINPIKDVAEMLRIVAANRAVPGGEKPKFNPKMIDIDSLLRKT
jgi:hypothetical protein